MDLEAEYTTDNLWGSVPYKCFIDDSFFIMGEMANMDYFVDRGQKGKKRPEQHIIGESGVSVFKGIIPKEWAVREYTPDYGIDLDVELFEDLGKGIFRTLGEHVLFQVKGTYSIKKKTVKLFSRMNVEKEYKKEKSEYCVMEVVQYPIDTDLLATVERMGSAVPVLLSVVDLESKLAYFVCLNDYIEKILIPEKPDFYDQKTVIINIPVRNCVNTDEGRYIIEWYGKRPKLYAFFNKVHYQLCELDYTESINYKERTDHFLRILCRLDVWSAVDYFPALKIMKKEIDYYLEHQNTKDGDASLKRKVEDGEDVDSEIYEGTYCVGVVSYRHLNLVQSLHILWEKLSNISNIFEENTKEAFLPTKFSAMISYGIL